jgi:LPXTG-motif cell wall-anchored protein
MSATLEHQEGFGNLEYGSSLFSFWGVHPNFASFWQVPITGTSSVLKPSFIGFATLALGGFFLARKRNEAQFAMLLAAIGAAIQLWKTHAGGTYVEWYYPLILIGLLCYRAQVDAGGAAAAPPVDEAPAPTTAS